VVSLGRVGKKAETSANVARFWLNTAGQVYGTCTLVQIQPLPLCRALFYFTRNEALSMSAELTDLERCRQARRRLQEAMYHVNEACALLSCVGRGERLQGALSKVSGEIGEIDAGVGYLANRVREQESAHA